MKVSQPPEKVFDILMEELKARHSEINLLNQQIGTIYTLTVTVIGATCAVIIIPRLSSSNFDINFANQSQRVISALFCLIYISLLLLKNQFNARIATQSYYILYVLRPGFEKLTGIAKENFLCYEDFMIKVRKKRLGKKVAVRKFVLENVIIGIPMLGTICFSFIGAIIQPNYIEILTYSILIIFAIAVWNKAGGLWLTLDQQKECFQQEEN